MLNKLNTLVHFKLTDKTSQNTRRIRQQSIIVYACVRKNELHQENRLKTLIPASTLGSLDLTLIYRCWRTDSPLCETHDVESHDVEL